MNTYPTIISTAPAINDSHLNIDKLMVNLLNAGYIHNERPTPPAPTVDSIKTDVLSNSAAAFQPAKKEEEIVPDLTQFDMANHTMFV